MAALENPSSHVRLLTPPRFGYATETTNPFEDETLLLPGLVSVTRASTTTSLHDSRIRRLLRGEGRFRFFPRFTREEFTCHRSVTFGPLWGFRWWFDNGVEEWERYTPRF